MRRLLVLSLKLMRVNSRSIFSSLAFTAKRQASNSPFLPSLTTIFLNIGSDDRGTETAVLSYHLDLWKLKSSETNVNGRGDGYNSDR